MSQEFSKHCGKTPDNKTINRNRVLGNLVLEWQSWWLGYRWRYPLELTPSAGHLDSSEPLPKPLPLSTESDVQASKSNLASFSIQPVAGKLPAD